MQVITRKLKAKEAAEKFKERYNSQGYKRWRNYGFGDTEQIYKDLKSLGENPSPDDVDKIIGNKSWTEIVCDECNNNVEDVVRLGEEPDFGSRTAYICLDCLEKAIKKL
jgi:hypothetical protein